MQIILQSLTSHRTILLAILVILIMSATWRFASVPASVLSLPDSFLPIAASRTNASIDNQIQRLQDQLKRNPSNWQVYSQLGLAYLQKARETGDPSYYPKAEEALNRALSFRPDDYASISAKGALALARHDFSSALQWGERARQINPDRPYAYGVIADAQIELGQYLEAVNTLQTMVELRPDMNSYARISYIRELHGDTSGALDMMQRAVESGTPNSESTAWLRTQLANLYFNTGDIDRAEREYQRALQDRPGYVYAIAGLGRVHAARGDMNAAIELMNQAVAVMPMPEFVVSLGEVYQVTSRPEKARQQYQLLETMEKLYRLNGVDMDMEIALFNADHKQRLSDTVDMARNSYRNHPSIHAADTLAWTLYQIGRHEEAQKYSQEALKLGTKDALKYYHAGMIAYALQDNEQALHYLEQALAINPHFSLLHAKEAQKTLQSLQQAETK